MHPYIPANLLYHPYHPTPHLTSSTIPLPLPIHFPEDIQIILRADRINYGNLYIANIEAAENPSTLQKYHIGGLISCAKGNQVTHPKNIIRYQKYLPIEDHENSDIREFLDEAVDFISEKLTYTNVLIHCIAGNARSVALVIAFFMREKKLTFQEAFNEVKSKKKIIQLSHNFIRQLQEYQSKSLKQKTKQSFSENYSQRKFTEEKIIDQPRSQINNLSRVSEEKPLINKTRTENVKTLRTERSNGKQLQKSMRVPSIKDDKSQYSDRKSMRSYTESKNHYISILEPKEKSLNPEDNLNENNKSKKSFTLSPQIIDNKSRKNSMAKSIQLDNQHQHETESIISNATMERKNRKSNSRSTFEKKMSIIHEKNTVVNDQLQEIRVKYEEQSTKLAKMFMDEHEILLTHTKMLEQKSQELAEQSPRKTPSSLRNKPRQIEAIPLYGGLDFGLNNAAQVYDHDEFGRYVSPPADLLWRY